jgi:multisubunit Na+/H+ antiporter MnhB subunit
VPPTERGTVVGTATVFLDLVFGFAPAVLRFVAEATDFGVTFLVSAAFAALAATLLIARRESLERPLPVASG